MITYYPVRLLPYLQLRAQPLPSHLSRLYYLSWEDALWELLPQYGVQPGSTILLPDFYCLDVISNISLHGYRVALYPLNQQFQISRARFLKLYKQLKPEVVIIFHALGISSQLMRDQSLIRQICRQSVLIEDQVHRIINPESLKILHDNHLVLDSLRKNLPLPGSFVYLTPNAASKLTSPKLTHPLYVFKVSLYYLIYRFLLKLGLLFRSRSLITYADDLILTRHDNLVGDSHRGNRGLPWIPHLHRHLSHSKIRTYKINQVKLYRRLLKSLNSPDLFIPELNESELGDLHAYPLVVSSPLNRILERTLNPLNVWSKFSDSPWSHSRFVFCLPLGLHLKVSDQHQIAAAILKACPTA